MLFLSVSLAAVNCLCFFSSSRRHTSCSLVTGVQTCALPISDRLDLDRDNGTLAGILEAHQERVAGAGRHEDGVAARGRGDRKSVVEGKSVAVRVAVGGRSIDKNIKASGHPSRRQDELQHCLDYEYQT